MGWFSKYRHRKAIKKYLTLLGPVLRQRYGGADSYTIGQVQTTIGVLNLPLNYAAYGCAIFLSADDFDQIRNELPGPPDYETVRQEIADLFFSSDRNFMASKAMRYGSTTGDVGIDGGPIGDSGGGGGGGGDGGGD